MKDLFNNPLPRPRQQKKLNPWHGAWKNVERRCTAEDREHVTDLLGVSVADQQKLLKMGIKLVTMDTELNYEVAIWLAPEECGCPKPPIELKLALLHHPNASALMTSTRELEMDSEDIIVAWNGMGISARSVQKLLKKGMTLWHVDNNRAQPRLEALNNYCQWQEYADVELADGFRLADDHIEVGF